MRRADGRAGDLHRLDRAITGLRGPGTGQRVTPRPPVPRGEEHSAGTATRDAACRFLEKLKAELPWGLAVRLRVCLQGEGNLFPETHAHPQARRCASHTGQDVGTVHVAAADWRPKRVRVRWSDDG